MAGTSDSSEDERARTLSAIRVERFRRLMAAQERIAEALTPYGVTDAQQKWRYRAPNMTIATSIASHSRSTWPSSGGGSSSIARSFRG